MSRKKNARPGEAEFLATYDASAYPRPSVTVDVVCLTMLAGQPHVLLVRRGDHPYKGYWALPGGFLDLSRNETLLQAAERELAEETGVTTFTGHLEQLETFGDPGRDPRGPVVSVAYLAFCPPETTHRAGSDAAETHWWALADLNLPGSPAEDPADSPALAFDHDRILSAGVERARAKLEYTTVATSFCPPQFTLSDLRRVYEAFWGVSLHRPNFARRVLEADGFVTPTDQTRGGGPGKPAALYTAGPAFWLRPPLMRPTTAEESR